MFQPFWSLPQCKNKNKIDDIYKFNIKDTKQIEISLTYIYKMIIILSVVSNKILKSNISDYL